ncbi:Cystathionine beta-synthase, partial [Orchesella cincta]
MFYEGGMPKQIVVDFKKNTFTDVVEDEEDLMKIPTLKSLVVAPRQPGKLIREFLSTEWMVAKNYYNPLHLESLYWWYDMALQNISPRGDHDLFLPPTTPVKNVLRALKDTENSPQENDLIETICHHTFGVIDSTATFFQLETLLQKFHWVIKVHRVTYYANENESKSTEDVIGVINLADFINYKRAVEAHHLSEYGMAMSDGIPSIVWVENFAEFSNASDNKTTTV